MPRFAGHSREAIGPAIRSPRRHSRIDGRSRCRIPLLAGLPRGIGSLFALPVPASPRGRVFPGLGHAPSSPASFRTGISDAGWPTTSTSRKARRSSFWTRSAENAQGPYLSCAKRRMTIPREPRPAGKKGGERRVRGSLRGRSRSFDPGLRAPAAAYAPEPSEALYGGRPGQDFPFCIAEGAGGCPSMILHRPIYSNLRRQPSPTSWRTSFSA